MTPATRRQKLLSRLWGCDTKFKLHPSLGHGETGRNHQVKVVRVDNTCEPMWSKSIGHLTWKRHTDHLGPHFTVVETEPEKESFVMHWRQSYMYSEGEMNPCSARPMPPRLTFFFFRPILLGAQCLVLSNTLGDQYLVLVGN